MVSIIIPAHNEENYIEKTLQSVSEQTLKEKEIIVVCNGCTDNTPKIAKKYTSKVFELKTPDLVEARNYGASKAQYSQLIFLDADTQFQKNSTLQTISETKSPIGTCKGSPDNKKVSFQLFWFLKNRLLKKGRVSGITFCNKDIFNKVSGYDPNSQPFENLDLVKKFKEHGNFLVVNDKVITSTRRLEALGLFSMLIFWVKKLIKNDHQYPVIR